MVCSLVPLFVVVGFSKSWDPYIALTLVNKSYSVFSAFRSIELDGPSASLVAIS